MPGCQMWWAKDGSCELYSLDKVCTQDEVQRTGLLYWGSFRKRCSLLSEHGLGQEAQSDASNPINYW
jgi:hypothetical protein